MFTGLFYRDEIAAYYRANGLPEPYDDTARSKIVPEMEQRILAAFAGSPPLFRKTSCAVSYAHALPDYNGHVRHQGTVRHLPAEPARAVPPRPPDTDGRAGPAGRPRAA